MTRKTKAQLLEELEGMKRDYKSLEDDYKMSHIYERWYKNLRQKEVIVMEEEGALYLKGADLDRYCRKITPSFSRAEVVKELLPALSKLFGDEYEKYNEAIEKELNDGNDAGSESKEADQKDSGHDTYILRYANRYGLR